MDDVAVRKAYFDTAHGQLHCRTSKPPKGGSRGGPPVLLLHMSASSSKCWIPLMRRLSSLGFECFAPDMPGFGQSFDIQKDPPNIEWYSRLYYQLFLKFAEFNNGCHIIGHHSGAIIGTDLAGRYHGFAASLTLVGPAVMSAEERRVMSEKTLIPFNKPVEDGSHLTKTWEYLVEKGIPRDNIDLLQREVMDHARAWEGRMQIYACVWAYDCAAAMESIGGSCKVLALCASDDILWPCFKNVRAVREDARVKEIKGANFEPDLGMLDILDHFLALLDR